MSTFRIALIGLDEWEANFVAATIEIAVGTDIGNWRQVASGEDPDALMVRARPDADVPVLRQVAAVGQPADGAQGVGALRPVVIVCAERGARERFPAALVLERPITYPGLIASLRDAEARLRETSGRAPLQRAAAAANIGAVAVPVAPPQPKASVPAVPLSAPPGPAASPAPAVPAAPASPAPARAARTLRVPAATARADTLAALAATLARRTRPSRRFRENTRLLGILQYASLRRGVTEITHPGFPSLMIIPAEHAYACEVDPASVASMFRTPAWSFTTREIGPVAAARLLAGVPRQPLWRLLYCAALFGSEARLLVDVGPDDQLRLIAAPDFAAVPHDTVHRAVASHMLSHVDTLVGIVRSTGASLETVIGFCNACEQVGLIERNGGPARRTISLEEHSGRWQVPPPPERDARTMVAPGNGGILRAFKRIRGLFR